MDELVFYVKRSNAIFGVIATTPFILAGLAMVVAGFVIAGEGADNVDDGVVFGIIGVLGMAPFCFFFVQSLRNLRAPGRLRLTTHGFDLYKNSFAWTDVEDFHSKRVGGDSPTTYVKVIWAPGARQHPAVRRSATFEKLGQSTAPTHIGFDDFDTGGRPLLDVLREWLQRSRDA